MKITVIVRDEEGREIIRLESRVLAAIPALIKQERAWAASHGGNSDDDEGEKI